MFYYDNKQHHLPHIHVEYQGKVVVLSIPNGEILEGSIPSGKLKLAKHGLRYTKMNLSLIGSWLEKEARFLK